MIYLCDFVFSSYFNFTYLPYTLSSNPFLPLEFNFGCFWTHLTSIFTHNFYFTLYSLDFIFCKNQYVSLKPIIVSISLYTLDFMILFLRICFHKKSKKTVFKHSLLTLYFIFYYLFYALLFFFWLYALHFMHIFFWISCILHKVL